MVGITDKCTKYAIYIYENEPSVYGILFVSDMPIILYEDESGSLAYL